MQWCPNQSFEMSRIWEILSSGSVTKIITIRNLIINIIIWWLLSQLFVRSRYCCCKLFSCWRLPRANLVCFSYLLSFLIWIRIISYLWSHPVLLSIRATWTRFGSHSFACLTPHLLILLLILFHFHILLFLSVIKTWYFYGQAVGVDSPLWV